MSASDNAAPAADAATTNAAKTEKPSAQQADEMSPILEKFTLVTLSDGRQIFGTLIAFDANGNLLLNETVERRSVQSSADASKNYVTQRQGMTMAIPIKHVTGFYQRDSRPPEIEALIEEETKKAKAIEEAAAASAPTN